MAEDVGPHDRAAPSRDEAHAPMWQAGQDRFRVLGQDSPHLGRAQRGLEVLSSRRLAQRLEPAVDRGPDALLARAGLRLAPDLEARYAASRAERACPALPTSLLYAAHRNDDRAAAGRYHHVARDGPVLLAARDQFTRHEEYVAVGPVLHRHLRHRSLPYLRDGEPPHAHRLVQRGIVVRVEHVPRGERKHREPAIARRRMDHEAVD